MGNKVSSKQRIKPKTNKIVRGFVIHLRPTYFNKGFFNVPVEYSSMLADDRDNIKIKCQGAGDTEGKINRRCNKNYTPRILGGVFVRNWFMNNFEINDKITVEVESPNSIILNKAKQTKD